MATYLVEHYSGDCDHHNTPLAVVVKQNDQYYFEEYMNNLFGLRMPNWEDLQKNDPHNMWGKYFTLEGEKLSPADVYTINDAEDPRPAHLYDYHEVEDKHA